MIVGGENVVISWINENCCEFVNDVYNKNRQFPITLTSPTSSVLSVKGTRIGSLMPS